MRTINIAYVTVSLVLSGCQISLDKNHETIPKYVYDIADKYLYQDTVDITGSAIFMSSDVIKGQTYSKSKMYLNADTAYADEDGSGHWIYFEDCTFTGITQMHTLDAKQLLNLELRRSSVDTIFMEGNPYKFILDSTKAKFVQLIGNRWNPYFGGEETPPIEISINNTEVNDVLLGDLDIIRGNVINSIVQNRLEFSKCSIYGKLEIIKGVLPDSLIFKEIAFDSTSEIIIRRASVSEKPKICNLKLVDVDLNKFDIEYENIKLSFPKNFNEIARTNTYQRLLDNFTRRNNSRGAENLTKEFKQFKYTYDGSISGRLLNWIDRWWWDYGYNKFLVIRGAIVLNVIFFLINIVIFNSLLYHGYKLEKFAAIDERIDQTIANPFRRFLSKLPYIYLYSSYIFWGLKLDFEKLEIGRIGLFAYILLQYIVGVICLAYIANLIITV